jgi:hypothetical protein
MGITRGGVRFNPGVEIRNIPYDGKLTGIKGLDRIVNRDAQISFTLIEASNANLSAVIEAGGATPGTLQDSGVLFASGDYLTGLAVEFTRPGATPTKFGYYFANAICTQYEVQGQGSDGEVEIAVTFSARLAHGATPDETDVPFTLFDSSTS